MIELIAAAIVSLAVGYIGYCIGRQHGFEAGREYELDRVAQRHIRMKRFYETH